MSIFVSPRIVTTQRIGSRADRTVRIKVIDQSYRVDFVTGELDRYLRIVLQITNANHTCTEQLDMTPDVARQLRDQLDRAITAYEEAMT